MDFLRSVQSIYVRHRIVEDDYVRVQLNRLYDTLPAAAGLATNLPILTDAKQELERGPCTLVIIHDKDSHEGLPADRIPCLVSPLTTRVENTLIIVHRYFLSFRLLASSPHEKLRASLFMWLLSVFRKPLRGSSRNSLNQHGEERAVRLFRKQMFYGLPQA